MSATSKALRTYELIEAIFHLLDPADIPRVRQVCKGWQDVADRSEGVAALVRSRYLRPESRGWLTVPTYYIREGVLKIRPILCPEGHRRFECVKLFVPNGRLRNPTTRAKWMQYQITEPPITEVHVTYESLENNGFRFTRKSKLVRRQIHEQDGVRIGHLIEAGQDLSKEFDKYATPQDKSRARRQALKAVAWIKVTGSGAWEVGNANVELRNLNSS